MDRTRRAVLASCGTALGAGLAGCNNAPLIGGGGDDDSDGGNSDDGTGGYAQWLGPEMADAQWVYYQESDIDVVPTVIGKSPATAISANLNADLVDTWRKQTQSLDTQTTSFDLDPSRVDRSILDPNRTFGIVTGDFDTEAWTAELESEWTHRGTHRGRDLYAAEFPRNDRRAWEGIAVGPGTLAVVYAAPDAERATEWTKSMLDTEAGATPRFTETDDIFTRLTDLLNADVYVSYQHLGMDGASGLSLSVSGLGNAVERRTATYVPDDPEAFADDYRERVSVRATPSERDDDLRLNEKFVAYEDYEVRTDGDFVVFEGTIPASKVGHVDLRWP